MLLAAFIVGGNGLLIRQYRIARQQTENLAFQSRQTTAILRLQYDLVSFHQNLDELVESNDRAVLSGGITRLQSTLLTEIKQTRESIRVAPSGSAGDSRLLQMLDAIEIGIPRQVEVTMGLAATGDWDAVKQRVAHQLDPTESEVRLLALERDSKFTAELARSESNLTRVQTQILILIPSLTCLTLFTAAFFVWLIAQRMNEVRFHERMRITRELHDTFLQTIVASKFYAEVVLSKEPDVGKLYEAVAKLSRWLHRANEEARSAFDSLRTEGSGRLDLTDALHELTAKATLHGPMSVTLDVLGTPLDVLPEVQIEIIRIAGEALTNAQKHAEASQVRMKLEFGDPLILIVSDDGVGFDCGHVAEVPNGHFGLMAMRERSARIGGSFTISSSPDSGTEVKLTLPKRNLSRRLT